MPFIKKTFEWFLTDGNRFLFKAYINNKIVGYLGGLCPQYPGDGSTSGMMRYAMRQAIAGILKKPWLLVHKEIFPFYPLIFRNTYRQLFKINVNGAPTKRSNDRVFEKKTGLVVIGVHPDYRGGKIFQLLMNELENETRKRNINKMILTVKKENVGAVKAYEKAGWAILKENKKILEMYKGI